METRTGILKMAANTLDMDISSPHDHYSRKGKEEGEGRAKLEDPSVVRLISLITYLALSTLATTLQHPELVLVLTTDSRVPRVA